MAGHSKWSQIKRQKAADDGKRSKIFARLSKAIILESKQAKGNITSPALRNAIESAKKENMSKETIDRAIAKGAGSLGGDFIDVLYEAYGPGGCALLIEGQTDNNNRTTQEMRHLLSKNNGVFAERGAAMWAFQKSDEGYTPTVTVKLSDKEEERLGELIEIIEGHDDVENVYTNAE